MPTFSTLSWLFAIGVTIHNAEEAWLLPGWSQTAGRWHHPVRAPVFRFAVSVLTLLAYTLAAAVSIAGKASVPAYLIAGYALAMLLNVVIPHLLATLSLRRYAPGTLTALLLNLPITLVLLGRGFEEAYLQWSTFSWSAPLVVGALIASLPVLFRIGARWFPNSPSGG